MKGNDMHILRLWAFIFLCFSIVEVCKVYASPVKKDQDRKVYHIELRNEDERPLGGYSYDVYHYERWTGFMLLPERADSVFVIRIVH